MSMKLSYRDKVIFIVVIVLVIIVGGFFIFVKAKITESQNAKNDLVTKEQEKQATDDKIATLDDLKKQLENDIQEVDDMQSSFLDEQTDFEADKYLYELLSPTGVQFRTLQETRSVEGQLSEYYYTRESLAYDIKINADLTGDSLPQEVYDKYYETEIPQNASVLVAKNTVEMTLGVGLDDQGAPDFDMIEEVWDTIAEHDKTINLYSFSKDETVSVGSDDDAEAFETIKVVVDVYSIHHMDTSQAK